MASRGSLLLVWLLLVHFAGIYLYTRGFLLTRLSLSDVSPPNEDWHGTYNRTVLLIIDALRFDFISPDPPQPPSPHHHNVLTLPAELTAKHPDRSFIYSAFADPPTTTLQRIKGITAGSLPTFIDMGSNFAGYSILEDSIISQLRAAGKKIALMGDDTWMTVYPTSFEEDMRWPYDSFNVEDLHTVDNGVIEHIFPLLRNESKPWDFLIGHFLGVDHVGHRLGPEHPIMKTKLEQMDRVLRDVVDLLDDDTLLVLMGDHGMDRKGDHGGDTELEVTSGVWFYSKGRPLYDVSASIPPALAPREVFPGATVPHRAIQQIDLVPTFALLLGLPIPYNNLGSVIPELFWDDKEGTRFARALDMNAVQIRRYLKTYRASPHGGELEDAWASLESSWHATTTETATSYRQILNDYTRAVLAVCRDMWAQFNISLIGMGLSLMVLSTYATWGVWCSLAKADNTWEEWLARFLWRGTYGAGAGFATGLLATPYRQLASLDTTQPVIFSTALVSVLAVLPLARPTVNLRSLKSLPLPMFLHAAAFASNSFTVWEDHIINYVVLSMIVPKALIGLAAPTKRLRYRILGFSALFALCIRLMAISTVCREEQQPHCHVTFYTGESVTVAPLLMALLSLPSAVILPWIVKRFLRISQSDRGVAGLFLPWILSAVLIQASLAWLFEWADTADVLAPSWAETLRMFRTVFGWGAALVSLVVGGTLWWFVPLCLNVSTKDGRNANAKKEVTVIGFANAFGSPYLIFWLVTFGLYYTVSQPTAQVVLVLLAVALLAYLEIVDSVRDVHAMDAALSSSKPSTVLELNTLPSGSGSVAFGDVAPLAVLALFAFYTTGHQSTVTSIQWKAAFVLTPTLAYPASPVLVTFNTFGPQFLVALAAPLVALWNLAPLPHPAANVQARRESVRAALGVVLYHSTLLLGSSVTAAWLRRHLMVWKIFAPRFMSAAASLLAVDLALVVGVGLGVERVAERVGHIFGGPAMAAVRKEE